jgi:lysyl endopeptidase
MHYGRSVAVFLANRAAGTGTLLNNTINNGRAFFLSAIHVPDRGAIIPKWGNGRIDADEEATFPEARFGFRFWRTACNGTTNSSIVYYTGATMQMQFSRTDALLLELTNAPGIGDGVTCAGWNRQTSSPPNIGSFIPHHPEVSDMRITNTNDVKTWFWNSKFWSDHYSSVTVTRGFSGAALFNQTGQVVGQLRGGWSGCTFTNFGDRYGKFHVSWSGGMQPFLSPGQSLNATSTMDPTSMIGGEVIGCQTQNLVYSVPSLLTCTYVWTNSSNITMVSGQNTASAIFKNNSTLPTDAGWVRVTITDSRGNQRTAIVTKTVQLVSHPTPGPVSWTWNALPSEVLLDVADVPGAISYNWYLNGVLKANTVASTYQLPMSGNVSCRSF